MARYLIESPHTDAECLQALDEVLKGGKGMLSKWDWGCMAGDHRGWAIVETDTESAALNMVPSVVRSKAHVVRLNKFTPNDLEQAHKMKV